VCWCPAGDDNHGVDDRSRSSTFPEQHHEQLQAPLPRACAESLEGNSSNSSSAVAANDADGPECNAAAVSQPFSFPPSANYDPDEQGQGATPLDEQHMQTPLVSEFAIDSERQPDDAMASSRMGVAEQSCFESTSLQEQPHIESQSAKQPSASAGVQLDHIPQQQMAALNVSSADPTATAAMAGGKEDQVPGGSSAINGPTSASTGLQEELHLQKSLEGETPATCDMEGKS
jgi:hypothetical protein